MAWFRRNNKGSHAEDVRTGLARQQNGLCGKYLRMFGSLSECIQSHSHRDNLPDHINVV
jgi:hypothetical protein